MNHQEFMRSLRRVPNHPNNKIVARTYKNAKGADELIFLHQGHWDYVEWLEARGNIVFAKWVIHCDNNPVEDFTLSHLLMYWLWEDECIRFREDMPTPHPYPPMGYEGWADQHHGKTAS